MLYDMPSQKMQVLCIVYTGIIIAGKNVVLPIPIPVLLVHRKQKLRAYCQYCFCGNAPKFYQQIEYIFQTFDIYFLYAIFLVRHAKVRIETFAQNKQRKTSLFYSRNIVIG
jgi:hypothetical protein